MSRIRYLAMLSGDPAALAGFYGRHFGMDELGRSAAGDVTMTDGGFNLTLLRPRPELREPHMALGLHHLGIAVDDIDAVVARYRALQPRGTVVAESGDLQHGEARIYDPECNPVTLSQRNFGLPASEPRTPRSRPPAARRRNPTAAFHRLAAPGQRAAHHPCHRLVDHRALALA